MPSPGGRVSLALQFGFVRVRMAQHGTAGRYEREPSATRRSAAAIYGGYRNSSRRNRCKEGVLKRH